MRVLLLAIVACHARQPVDIDDDDIPDVDDRCPDLPSACVADQEGCPDVPAFDIGPEVGAAEKLDALASEVPATTKIVIRGEPVGAHLAAHALEVRGVAPAT